MTPGDRRALKTIALLVALGGLARFRLPDAGSSVGVEYVVAGSDRSNRDSLANQSLLMSTPLGRGEKIDISTSSATEIDRLPGIGPALAARIVSFRAEHGPFGSIEDLTGVPGIGPVLSQRLGPHVLFRSGTRRIPTRSGPGVIRINTASSSELAELPGIGPGRAAAIIAYREAHGPFKSVGDLTLVQGIGPGTVKKLEGRARVP